MTGPERWQQVKRIFHAALTLPPDKREAFLAETCRGQDSLRKEVESLIRSHEETGSFIDSPAYEKAMLMPPGAKNVLAAGQLVGHYRISSMIGAGGMGEVYLAEDTRLRRKVALKVLPESIASDKDRLLRFEREAFAASALNHPNILTIFEFGADGPTHFLASEFVAGETLREHLRRGELTVSETLEITLQIASALQAAHNAGIIHRDIKPENVMIRDDGYVKVVDFGLAKLEPRVVAHVSEEEAETRRQLQTQAGTIMGTVAYMSPEQARGKEVDARSDLFSLGVVLYEMLARRQPFTGETVNHTIVAILEKKPVPVSEFFRNCSFDVDKIIDKVLAKESSARYQSAKELLVDLKDAQQELEFQSRLERSSSPGLRDETASTNSIAVLPFTNMSADADNEYFCDGLAEELLNALAKIDNLKVAARTSAFSFKGKNAEAREIGRILNVNTVLEGSVRKSGNRIRITVQLINAADGYQIWSERYDREMKDIFDIQDEITLAVVDGLKVKLLGEKKAAVLKRYTDNTEAYQLYLKGQFHYGKYSAAGWRKAIEYFEQALALEPEYAPAHAGVAAALSGLWYYGHDSGSDVISKMRAAIAGALQIDADLAEAHRAQALLQFFVDWNFPAAEKSLKRTLALNPNDALAHAWHSFWLIVMGHREQAVAAARRAQELDPLSLVSGIIAGWTFWFAERYEECIGFAQTLLGIDAHFGEGFRMLGLSHWALKNYAAAEDALRSAVVENAGLIALADLCGVYAHAGRDAEAQECLKQILAVRERSYVPAVVLAYAYAFLNEVDEAFVWLDQALVERNGELVFWRILPDWFISFRRDSRFLNFLRRIGPL
jgi:serine/threonine-protein kinase